MVAANHLQHLMEMMDNEIEIDDYLSQNYVWLDDQIVESIDKRKFLLREIESKLNILKDMKKEITSHSNRLKRIQESVKQSTKLAIEQNPRANIRDSIGNKVSVCHSKPTVEVNAPTTEEKVKNVVSRQVEQKIYSMGFGKYLFHETFVTLDVESIQRDLEKGEDLTGFATLKQNAYVRGL